MSIYTAVAARIGSNRVTLQPNLSGEPDSDPSGMQLRVNGQLVTLTDSGIDLLAGGAGPQAPLEGRIVTARLAVRIEITDARGTQLVATPAFWNSQQKWYLNLNVYQTSAIRGIWGRLAGRQLAAGAPRRHVARTEARIGVNSAIRICTRSSPMRGA